MERGALLKKKIALEKKAKVGATVRAIPTALMRAYVSAMQERQRFMPWICPSSGPCYTSRTPFRGFMSGQQFLPFGMSTSSYFRQFRLH